MREPFRRKQLSLVLAGRIKPHEASELQSLSKIWRINSHSALPIGFSDKLLGHFLWDYHRVHIG